MKGRKPKATKLKLIAGNPGKRPLNEAEPEFSPADLEPLAYLADDQIACEVWKEVAPELHRNGLLMKVGRPMLAFYCQTVSKARRAETANDFRENVKLAKAIASEFGFTPASSARLHIKPAEKPKDDEQRYFG